MLTFSFAGHNTIYFEECFQFLNIKRQSMGSKTTLDPIAKH